MVHFLYSVFTMKSSCQSEEQLNTRVTRTNMFIHGMKRQGYSLRFGQENRSRQGRRLNSPLWQWFTGQDEEAIIRLLPSRRKINQLKISASEEILALLNNPNPNSLVSKAARLHWQRSIPSLPQGRANRNECALPSFFSMTDHSTEYKNSHIIIVHTDWLQEVGLMTANRHQICLFCSIIPFHFEGRKMRCKTIISPTQEGAKRHRKQVENIKQGRAIHKNTTVKRAAMYARSTCWTCLASKCCESFASVKTKVLTSPRQSASMFGNKTRAFYSGLDCSTKLENGRNGTTKWKGLNRVRTYRMFCVAC